jgi:hypothetical protein
MLCYLQSLVCTIATRDLQRNSNDYGDQKYGTIVFSGGTGKSVALVGIHWQILPIMTG